jgi:hypothetical protein
MADVFGTGGRGCFKVIKLNASQSIGAYIQLPGGGNLPSSQTDLYLVTGFKLVRNEIITHNVTFGGSVYSYAFGNDPGTSALDVSLTAFMADGAKALGAIDGAYQAGRVSKLPAKGKFSMGGTVIEGYVVNLSSSTINTEFNLQDFSIRLALTEV